MMTRTTAQELITQLATIEPIETPAGEPGVTLPGESGQTGQGGQQRQYAPVLSVYLDLETQAPGDGFGARASRTILHERLHQIAQTFRPRGVAFESVNADAERVERYLDTQFNPSTQGVAIFASAAHHLFTVYEAAVPFTTEVSARAVPSLFQLVRHLDQRGTAVVAVVDTRAARLFVTHLGALREIAGLHEDPKFHHMVHGVNAMNQAHYQRYARHVRAEFADEVAEALERLVGSMAADQVILAGDAVAVPLLRKALSPHIAKLVWEPALALDIAAPRDVIAEKIRPLLQEFQAERERSVLDRLVEAIRADGVGVAGVEPTRTALARGQADTLVLAADAPLEPEVQTALVELATRTDAEIAVVPGGEVLRQLGGVGALLRYRLRAPSEEPE